MEDIKSYLIFFNKKLKKLLQLAFSKKINSLNLTFTHDRKSILLFKEGQPQDIENNLNFYESNLPNGINSNGPTGEEIDSYILTLRFFIQNNDNISIKNWNEKVNASNLPSQLIQKANLLRTNLNKLLDSPRLNVKLINDRQILTTRDIIETYVYGEYAHSNFEKNKLFNEIGFENSDNISFILVAREISQILTDIYSINNLLIDSIQEV